MHGKKAFGFPSVVVPYAHMLVNESAIEEAGYSMDNLQTFADIFEFSNNWTKTYQETDQRIKFEFIYTEYLRRISLIVLSQREK